MHDLGLTQMKNFLAYSQELHGSVKISYSFSVDSAIWNALLFGYSRAHFPFFFFFPQRIYNMRHVSTACVSEGVSGFPSRTSDVL